MQAISAITAKSLSDLSASPSKALGRAAKASRIPNAPIGPRTGTAATERIPRLRHASVSTRGSIMASWQTSMLTVRKHSPEIPDSVLMGAPIGGAMSPLQARQTMAPRVSSPRAVPSAPLKTRAASATASAMASNGCEPDAAASRRMLTKSRSPGDSSTVACSESGGSGKTRLEGMGDGDA
jgi:hypothetical protein